jgi:tRNA (guanine37-N1)-methyltransferase
MKFHIVTLFRTFFESVLTTSLVGQAIDEGLVEVEFHDPRDHGKGVHRQVDDAPYGGGAGMVMMPEPLAEILEPLDHTHRVLMSPSGSRLTQNHLDRFAELSEMTLVCGRYEGVDERIVEHFIDEEVSLGDFVLLGGEVAAAAIIEGVGRLLPGVIGNPASAETESFRGDGMLEEPQYTRPSDFRGWQVPDVLLSGNHAAIAEWRTEQRRTRTAKRRPDLLPAETTDTARHTTGQPKAESDPR